MRSVLAFVLATGLALPVARAQQSPAPVVRASAGAIVGIVKNSAKLPVAGATVTAARADGAAIRATVSGSDGVYSFADLPPGAWVITLQAEGSPEVAGPSLQVIAGKATRY